MDFAAELAALKAQMSTMMGAMQNEETISVSSIWVVHQPDRAATWCSKSDCPKLGRKKSYDLILKETQENEDGELEHLIKEGVAPEDVNDEEVETKITRVGGPTVKLHDLGVVAAFTTKLKAIAFIDEYFKTNQDQNPGELMMTEVKVTA
jgi:hypothetical protein